jgi:uncharacterized protein (TIGR00725 family)
MRKIVIGVMGPGANATKEDLQYAFKLGKLIASQGWILLSGGRDEGVMDAVNKGAKSAGGLTIGIIPTKDDAHTSEAVDVSIITGMGSARNNINVLSSAVVIACGMGAGTASEIALALKAKKQVVLLTDSQKAKDFFAELGSSSVHSVNTPEEAVEACQSLMLSRLEKS